MSESSRLRILLVTRNLPPLVGGMERLNWHMAEELARFAEVRMVGPSGAAAVAPAGVGVHEAPVKPVWRFLLAAARLARREAIRWQPDIVLAGSGLTAPVAHLAARTCGARTAIYVHGLDIAVRHAIYRALWLPAIRQADRVIANSRATAALCRDAGVDSARLGIVHPGVDLPVEAIPPGLSSQPKKAGAPHRRGVLSMDESATAFRRRHQLGNGPVLLSVGRLSARKGLREFVAKSLPCIVAAQPDAMLVVIGDAPSQALHAETQTPASIQTAADAAGVGANLVLLGKVSDAELFDAYRAADVHVFCIRGIPGDPEGFGMVAIEAAAYGLPTVAFAAGGVTDAVADGASGLLVSPGDYPGFADAVIEVLSDPVITPARCVAFARQFAWPEFGRQLVAQLPGK